MKFADRIITFLRRLFPEVAVLREYEPTVHNLLLVAALPVLLEHLSPDVVDIFAQVECGRDGTRIRVEVFGSAKNEVALLLDDKTDRSATVGDDETQPYQTRTVVELYEEYLRHCAREKDENNGS